MTENRYHCVLGTISEIMPAHKKSKCIKTLCREINACTRISQNTLLCADCLQRSSNSPVRRELCYSCRHKAGLLVFVIS